jgi:hypothetical protein
MTSNQKRSHEKNFMNAFLRLPLIITLLLPVIIVRPVYAFQPVMMAKSMTITSHLSKYRNSRVNLYLADGSASSPTDQQLLSDYNQAILVNPKDSGEHPTFLLFWQIIMSA